MTMQRRVMMKKKSDYLDRLLEVRRVTRVMAGGKRFSFRAAVVVGDGRGKVGLGIGKGLDVMSAVEKAKRQGEKHLIVVPLLEHRTIPHEVDAKYGAARVRMKPARRGHGLIAGSAARAVLELAGVRDVSAKTTGRTKNKITNARAALAALAALHPRKLPKESVAETLKSE
jgi:small subunit ribosomal protein S5